MGMMLNRRRVMGGKLPYDAEIEWLESSGTQEIDTLISANPTIGVRGSVIITRSGSQNICLGCTETGVFDGGKGFAYDVDGYCYVGGVVTSVQKFNVYTWVDFSVNYLNDGICIFNNTEKTITKGAYSTDVHISLYNFSRGNGSHSVYSPRACMFRDVTFTQGNVVIRDFIPVRVGQVGYMYDKVSGQLFANAGTGNFILGPDKGKMETSVNLNVKTHSAGSSDASLDVTTGDSEPVTIRYNEYWHNGYIGIYYGSSSWRVYAITSCLYNGQVYNSGDVIATWRYTETKDITIIANI